MSAKDGAPANLVATENMLFPRVVRHLLSELDHSVFAAHALFS